MNAEIWLELINWWATVRPEFALLLALPFLIGAAALLADWVRAAQRQPRPRVPHSHDLRRSEP